MREILLKDIDSLIERVRMEQVEIEIEATPEEQRVTIRPWRPFEYQCPYRSDK